jgi:uncharacterized protein YgbK (DUF1537 family)
MEGVSQSAVVQLPFLRSAEALASLPPPWPDEALLARIQAQHLARAETLVVVDDDPTGCQTVADVPLLFDWTIPLLSAELAERPAVLYVLTNSRAKPAAEAQRLNQALAANLRAAAAQTGRAVSVVSRSDSTLRGHFPAETDGLAAGLGPFRGILLAPYFRDGGRLTIGDVHYVQRGEVLVPAAETEFARDPLFGYRSSNMRAWAAEKSGGRWAAADIQSLSLDDIRLGGPDRVAQQLARCAGGVPVVVNAACDRDLEVVAWALLQIESGPQSLLPRSAASFVKARAGLPDRPLLTPAELGLDRQRADRGGLVVVGSYVPQTSAQLERLLALPDTRGLELDVPALLARAGSETRLREFAAELAQAAAAPILAGRTAVLYTSRALTAQADPLATGRLISQTLCQVLRELPVRPAYLIAKGGITSHELAQHGLGCQRATVLGQIAAGVPVWRLDRAQTFDNIPYVVFPGNVGQPGTLAEIVERLRS